MPNEGIWTPKEALMRVPRDGIKYPRLFSRTGDFSNEATFMDVLTSYLPDTPKPQSAGGQTFVNFLADMSSQLDGIFLAIIEATVVMKTTTCIDALKDGLEIADAVPELKNYVVPVIVVGDMAHTLYWNKPDINPDGPQEVVEESKALGAIPVIVTSSTLRGRITQVIEQILKGQMPLIP